nr:MAG TPA: hypothetical protein [Bacteriophage sp.]
MNNYYDCKKCLHEKICDLWSKHESQDASSFQLDGCDYYQDKSRYICVDDVNGPGPVCTEELCDCFSTRCENNCTKYLDVWDCKQAEPEEEP